MRAINVAAFIGLAVAIVPTRTTAVDIPLDTLTPVRIGYIDLQRVFDTYPEKTFAEGDLRQEIDKRRRDLSRRQQDITTLRQQIAADEAALTQSQSGLPVNVPANAVPEPAPKPVVVPTPVATPSASTTTATNVTTSSAPVVEPYPTEDPLMGLPGHEESKTPSTSGSSLPGVDSSGSPAHPSAFPLLDLLAASTGPVMLTPEAKTSLQDRITRNQRMMDRDIADFKTFRINAIGDMKALQNQKTYGVMSKIYAVLEQLARDENITVVLDKEYVLYGEDTIDLSDKLISRLQETEQ